MSGIDASVGMSGDMVADVLRSPQVKKAKGFRTPFGRVFFTRDKGESTLFASQWFMTNTTARHYGPDGRLIDEYDLGSGSVTNVGVLSMANDYAWAGVSGTPQATLALSNYHATGTGVTAAVATDVVVQTLAAPTTTTAVTGTQSLVSAANSQSYRSVATINYTSTLAITEWGLHNAATLSATTGTPFTATTASSATVTGTPYTASSTTVKGTPQSLIVASGTTDAYGLVLSNTTSVLTIPAWYKKADGTAATTPGSTEAFTLKPVLWDHKVFSAINVNNGDSIQFTYTLAINSGG